MNKSLLVAILSISAAGVVLLGGTKVLAADSGNRPAFVAELAQKLGIDQSKVQSAVDDIRKEHQADMQVKFNANLDQAVKDGKITEAQKQLIVKKHEELISQRQDFQNLTPEERKTQMQNQKQQLDDWAKQNDIDLKYLFGPGPFGHFGGFKGNWDH